MGFTTGMRVWECLELLWFRLRTTELWQAFRPEEMTFRAWLYRLIAYVLVVDILMGEYLGFLDSILSTSRLSKSAVPHLLTYRTKCLRSSRVFPYWCVLFVHSASFVRGVNDSISVSLSVLWLLVMCERGEDGVFELMLTSCGAMTPQIVSIQ